MKAYGGVDVQVHIFLNHLEVSSQLYATAALSPGKVPLVPIG
jgi:hypothetical protein